ncbi:MAG: cytochrome c oxidase accessory protein CcoG [Proteobacteria bacterium]|nr:cytochrome c oxidase accessory protein CcoG [Pseudomonadota bacterium]
MIDSEKHDSSIPVPTMDSRGKRKWLYPDRRSGANSRKRKLTAFALIAIYLVTPWIQFQGRPLFRIDVLEKKAYFFGLVMRVNEANILAIILATFAIILLLATLVKGRIWCSFGCPQTVFVDWVIRPIEELIEGSAHHRRRIDRESWTFQTWTKKIFKHILFFGVAFIVSNAFLAYFIAPDKLLHWMIQPPSEHPVPFLFMTAVLFVFYGDLAWFREQFCAYLCPYARFQSVMIDQDTPTVSYDAARGEPRGRGDKKGDCIDCQLCVRVCPTGIDIRQGLQLECVMCARCIDACNLVMTNVKKPTGLIRLASQNELLGSRVTPVWKRPKVIAYTIAIGILLSIGIMRTFGRSTLAINVIRAPGASFSTLPDQRHGNMFILQIANNSDSDLHLSIQPQTKGLELLCAECNSIIKKHGEIRISAIAAFDAGLSNSVATLKEATSSQTFELPLIGP